MSRKYWSAALTVALTASLAACGGDDADDGGATGTTVGGASDGSASSGAAAPGVTDDEVLVTGFFSSGQFGDAEAAARARIERANAEGGVHGRQIVIDEMHDDGGDPNTSLQQVQDVIGRGETFAAVPVLTSTFNGFEAMTEAEMPFFGWAIQPGWCGPQAFSFTGGLCEDAELATDMVGNLSEALDGGAEGRQVAIVGQDDDSAARASEGFAERWEELGADVALLENTIPRPPAVVSDFTPFATAVIDSGADLVQLPLNFPNANGMITKLNQLGFEGDIVNFVMYDPRVAALATDTLVVLLTAPWEQTDAPGIAQAIEDLEAHAPDTTLGLPALGAWLAADEFVAMLEAVGPELDRETWAATAETFTYDFGGAAGPIENPGSSEEPTGCNSVVRGTGEGYEVVLPYTCNDLIPAPN